MSVTPQEEMPARKASLLVRVSGRGWDDESRTRRWPRAPLTARPIVPLLEDRIVSILSLLMAGSSCVLTPQMLQGENPKRACVGNVPAGHRTRRRSRAQ